MLQQQFCLSNASVESSCTVVINKEKKLSCGVFVSNHGDCTKTALFRGLFYECLSISVLRHNPDVAALLDCLQVLHSTGYLSKRKDFHVLSC